MKQIKHFNENWKKSNKLKNVNDKTGVFDEDNQIDSDLHEYEKEIDTAFNNLFDQQSFEGILFGDNFNEYINSRQSQNNHTVTGSYQTLLNAYNDFKEALLQDLRDAADNYGH